MKTLGIRTQARMYWDYLKYIKFVKGRINTYNNIARRAHLSQENIEEVLQAHADKAEGDRKYVRAGHIKALLRDVQDQAYDTTTPDKV